MLLGNMVVGKLLDIPISLRVLQKENLLPSIYTYTFGASPTYSSPTAGGTIAAWLGFDGFVAGSTGSAQKNRENLSSYPFYLVQIR